MKVYTMRIKSHKNAFSIFVDKSVWEKYMSSPPPPIKVERCRACGQFRFHGVSCWNCGSEFTQKLTPDPKTT